MSGRDNILRKSNDVEKDGLRQTEPSSDPRGSVDPDVRCSLGSNIAFPTNNQVT